MSLILTKFLDWFDMHTTGNIIISLIITYLQIPHFIWAGDAYLRLGIVSHVHPILDFFLYGIDLIEIIPMISLTLVAIAKIKKRKK